MDTTNRAAANPEAVEEAAKALWEVDMTVLWDQADEEDREWWRAAARAALTAAAPHLVTDDRVHAERLAAALSLVLHDAHPTFGSTTKWFGGIGGAAITSHCSITQGAAPGTEWAEYDLPSKPLRDYLTVHQFDLDAAKAALKEELMEALQPADDTVRSRRDTTL